MKKIISVISAAALLTTLAVPSFAAEEAKLLAFPGAEGGGKYTTGARGSDEIEVYHVTNLNADGEGSLKDAISKPGRIVVFDVSGVIEVPEKLKFEQPNITVLGQTAPGDGITITGADIGLYADNTIIRYLRVRPTDKLDGEPDGLGGRWIDDIIVDHCSVSWGVDELLTVYAGSRESEDKEPASNISVQYCIASEALRMSSHIKGAHGYGGITGGENSSFHHNLMAHNDSRNPRLDRNLISTDIVNNVIYDWGINTIYGGEPYSYNKVEKFSTPEWVSNVNVRDNYYKYGPSTRDNVDHVRSRIFEATNDGKVTYNGETLKSNIYVENNYVWGDEETTKNNWNHNDTVKNQENINRLSEPVNMGEFAIPAQSAEDAYNEVLANAGATLPKRDSIDARIVNDVINGTGRIINQEEEVGRFTGVTSEERVFEIPQEWKAENNMGSAKETDIVKDGEFAGYTWIEAYVNDWTADQEAPSNPEIKVESPVTASYNTAIDATNGKGTWLVTTNNVTYKASASESVTKMELYDGTELLKAYDGAEINDSISLKPGTHYLFSRAYNAKGEKTDSDTAIVYVNGTGLGGELYASAEVGEGSFNGKGGAWYDASTDTYTVAGSGLIGGEKDSCEFAYGFVTGDFAVTAKVADIPKYENGVLSGIMLRESLDANSDMVMLGDGWLKGGENISVDKRLEGVNERVFMPLEDGKPADNSKNEHSMPQYLKMERKGNTLILSVSNDGKDWSNNDRKPMELDITGWNSTLYLGLATDSNDGLPMVPYYSQASFSEYKVEGGETPADTISLIYDENGVLTDVNGGDGGTTVYKIYKGNGSALGIRKTN
ncbi:MAG: hypothetical protein Q4G33_12690 [bacterium]|nr:hypothetical protein [bacterium]